MVLNPPISSVKMEAPKVLAGQGFGSWGRAEYMGQRQDRDLGAVGAGGGVHLNARS